MFLKKPRTLGSNMNHYYDFLKLFNDRNRENDKLTNHYLLNLINYTMPHIIIENQYNSHLLVDKLNRKVNHSHLFYNLHMKEPIIRENNHFLMNREVLLKKRFHNYEINCFTVGTGFYSKVGIPHNIQALHHERYDKLLGVNEYLSQVGCDVRFSDNKTYKFCFRKSKPFL